MYELLLLLVKFKEEINKMDFTYLTFQINRLIKKITPYNSFKKYIPESSISFFFDCVEKECFKALKYPNKDIDSYVKQDKKKTIDNANKEPGNINVLCSPSAMRRRIFEGNDDIFNKIKVIPIEKMIPENDFFGYKDSNLHVNNITEEINRLKDQSFKDDASNLIERKNNGARRRTSIYINSQSFIQQQEENQTYPFKQDALECMIF